MKDIKVGDTICCHDYADMNDVTIRIESVPVIDQTEQDGWITWKEQ